jgi:hypothetical protein
LRDIPPESAPVWAVAVGKYSILFDIADEPGIY